MPLRLRAAVWPLLALLACTRPAPGPAPTEAAAPVPDAHDLAILDRAGALLATPERWHQQDDRECGDDLANRRYSLFCALQAACVAELGRYDHRRAALEEVRLAVEEAARGREFQHRLMDFNNLPETGFADVKAVLAAARRRIAARMSRD